jgi:hypothetical protein
METIPLWELEPQIIEFFIPNPPLPNDGVVTVASQELPGALIPPVNVNNVTHFGEQTNVDVRNAINDQFRQVTAPDPIFRIVGCNF